jgi:hypothetical protein
VREADEHFWNGSKCILCGKTRDRQYDYDSSDPNARIHAIEYINSPDLLFSIATGGQYADVVELAAVKLTKLGDNRVFTNFDAIAHQGAFGSGGSYDYNEKLKKFISLAVNVPSEETVLFLKKAYDRRDNYMFAYVAFCAQSSLLLILKKVQGTPLASKIEEIDRIHIPVSYDADAW